MYITEIEEKIIKQFKNRSPRLIYLFGSYAKCRQRKNSDIDITILLDKEIDKIAISISLFY